MKRYVIIGGSIAGVSCVEGIRSVDDAGEITLVCAEKEANYGRPGYVESSRVRPY